MASKPHDGASYRQQNAIGAAHVASPRLYFIKLTKRSPVTQAPGWPRTAPQVIIDIDYIDRELRASMLNNFISNAKRRLLLSIQ